MGLIYLLPNLRTFQRIFLTSSLWYHNTENVDKLLSDTNHRVKAVIFKATSVTTITEDHLNSHVADTLLEGLYSAFPQVWSALNVTILHSPNFGLPLTSLWLPFRSATRRRLKRRQREFSVTSYKAQSMCITPSVTQEGNPIAWLLIAKRPGRQFSGEWPGNLLTDLHFNASVMRETESSKAVVHH